MGNPIRIGDTFTRTYTFFNPLVSNSKTADPDSPVDLTGQTIVFVIKNGSTITRYAAGKVVVTLLSGKVVVKLSVTDTADLKSGFDTVSYLEFTTGAEIKTTLQRKETVKKQSDV